LSQDSPRPLTGETLDERTANKSDEARLDVAARDFWHFLTLGFSTQLPRDRGIGKSPNAAS